MLSYVYILYKIRSARHAQPSVHDTILQCKNKKLQIKNNNSDKKKIKKCIAQNNLQKHDVDERHAPMRCFTGSGGAL